jgi:thiosulfate/3-mercaptopyruvate sulfurtransferase
MSKRWMVCALALAAHAATAAAQEAGVGAVGPVVSLEWLAQHLSDPGVVVIATDDTPPFDRGHIPNARFLSHDATLSAGRHGLLASADLAAVLGRVGATDAARIVIYGEPMAVGWLFYAFASLGHADHVSVLDGNVTAWLAAGHPASIDTSPAGSGRLTARPAAEIVVDRAWVRSHLDDASTRLLDVRSPQEWDRGMIPNAAKFLWGDLYSDVKARRLKTPAGIRAAFERAGVGPGQTAVTYCAIGMRASLAYFAARAAGIPARVYVGSWADWTSDPTSPVARGR